MVVRPPCTIEGCDKAARSGSSPLCPMHYHRQYRHGDTATTARHARIAAPRVPYKRTHVRGGHPIASADGGIYTHRLVLYRAIGEGPHPCHWCGTTLHWYAPRPDRPHDALHVDHLDGDRHNNDPANLVASCHVCNPARALQARSDALRAQGLWSNHDTIAARGTRSPRITDRTIP